MGKTKKQLEQIVLKKRQYRSNQGKTPRQQESNEKIMFVSFMGLLVTMLGMVLYGIFS
tara:strand:+ start:488 stop:661 length:174 start_codon:yes stop_codon:yes gene_type:complete